MEKNTNTLALQTKVDDDIRQLEWQGRQISRFLMTVAFTARLLTFTISFGPQFRFANYWITLAGIAADTLYKYYSTNKETVNGQSPWVANTMLWPQILSLSFSVVLIILTGSCLIAYARGVKAADRANNWTTKFLTYFPHFLDVLHTTFPMSVTISMFATSTDANALQFQSCTNNASFPHLNFSSICIMQVGLI